MSKRRLVGMLVAVFVAATCFCWQPSSAEGAGWRRGKNNYSKAKIPPYGRYPAYRTKGIKQLGPVPALGGVRSWPTWRGER